MAAMLGLETHSDPNPISSQSGNPSTVKVVAAASAIGITTSGCGVVLDETGAGRVARGRTGGAIQALKITAVRARVARKYRFTSFPPVKTING